MSENKLYLNWIKASLALLYFKQGISDYADEVAKIQHDQMLQSLGLHNKTACSLCNFKTLKPQHLPDRKANRCPKNQAKCNCLSKNTQSCPNNICDSIYDEIVSCHAKRQPYWANTDISGWITYSWEIAKCFINAFGYENTKSAADTDVAGLLHLFINNTVFRNHVSCPDSMFEKVRELRNFVFHSPFMEIDDQQLTAGFKDILTILEDEKELKSKSCSEQAVRKIRELQKENYVLKTETELMAISQVINLKEKVDKNEKDIQKLQERVKTLEDAGNLKSGQDKTAEQHNKLKRRIEFKKELKNFYRTTYLKTATCPLKPRENDTEIKKVYVQPYMAKVALAEETLETGERIEHTTQIRELFEIFESDGKFHRRIYIVGDVGMGKSALCKMLMSNWCLSIGNLQTPEDKSVKVMQQFEFLFYLPLCSLSEKGTIKDMILWYYNQEYPGQSQKTYMQTLREILNDIPERCLIVADGLDEWKPERRLRRQHENIGLPSDDGVKKVTIVMTSRPSAPGILNLQKSEYDAKIILNVISKDFIRAFVDKQQHSNSNDIFCELDKLQIWNVIETPLLLQQLIWILKEPNSKGIGKSISEIYTSAVNIVLRWYQRRLAENSHHASPTLTDMAFNEFQKEIFALCKVAYEILTRRCKSSFGSEKLKELGVNKEIRTVITDVGIITKRIRFDPTREDTEFIFTHTWFLEYFAALFISSNEKVVKLSSKKRKSESNVDVLLESCDSVEDVSQIENVLVIVCGLAPSVTKHVCRLFYEKCRKNKHVSLWTVKSPSRLKLNKLAEQCKKQVSRCIRECELSDNQIVCNIPLYIVNQTVTEKSDTLWKSINFQEIMCFIATDNFSVVDMPVLPKLQTLVLACCNLSNHEISLLAEYIGKTVTLRNIHLLNPEVSTLCDKVHVIDLVKHTQLQTLEVINFKCAHLQNVCTLRLEQCAVQSAQVTFLITNVADVSFSKADCPKLVQLNLTSISLGDKEMSNLVTFINQSVLLQELKLLWIRSLNKTNYSHGVNLSSHNQLKIVDVRHSHCELYQVNTSSLMHFAINKTNISFSFKHPAKLNHLEIAGVSLNHGVLLDLIDLLTCSVLMRNISMSCIQCSEHKDTCSVAVNFSLHDQLRELDVSNLDILYFQNINTLSLECCSVREARISFSDSDSKKISALELHYFSLKHIETKALADFITRSVSLKSIIISNILCSDHNKECSHAIDLSSHCKLDNLEFNKETGGIDLHLVNINTSTLRRCCTDTTEVLHCLGKSEKLEELNLFRLPYNKEVHASVLAMCHFRDLRLFLMTIEDDTFIMIPELENLQNITLYKVNMTESSWIRFLDSLVTLKQSVDVKITLLGDETVKNCVQKRGASFQVLLNESDAFAFKSLK